MKDKIQYYEVRGLVNQLVHSDKLDKDIDIDLNEFAFAFSLIDTTDAPCWITSSGDDVFPSCTIYVASGEDFGDVHIEANFGTSDFERECTVDELQSWVLKFAK